MLNKEQRERVLNWKQVIEYRIEDKEKQKESLKEKIEGLKFEVDMFRRVKDLIKEAMTLRRIEIEGVKKPCDSETLDLCMSSSKADQELLEKKLKTKRARLLGLELEIIVDHQKLILLKTDLEEK